MKKVRVFLKERSYDIVIGEGLLQKCGPLLKTLKIGRDAIVVTNRRLLALYRRPLEKSLEKSGFKVRFELVPDSEKAKSSNVAMGLIGRISKYDKNKSIFIIAFGGGVVGDLAGFIAAAYKRGISYVQIPTTLLAQVDSAIGGKVAIDLPIAKNLIGAFYQPRMVISDLSLLGSLSDRQIKNGLAEIIKYSIIKDKALFRYLEASYKKILKSDRKALEYVVTASSRIKASVVSQDEFDRFSKRVILNYGHTIGHAIEAASKYSNRYNHGEAIAVGMIIAARISLILGMLKKEDFDRIEHLIKITGLPDRVKGLKLSSVYESHLHDKKFVNRKNRFVLPVGIGNVKTIEGVSDYVVKDVLKKYIT